MCYLNGKFALVTGGARGIGLACIREFLINGVEGVTLIDLNAENGTKSTRLLNAEFGDGKVIFLKVDVSNKIELKTAFEKALKHWNRIDIVVNNAGNTNESDWKSLLLTNSGGALQGTLSGFEIMRKMQDEHGGLIINIASAFGLNFFPALPIYSATKSFIITLGRCLGSSIYFEHTNVKVVTVCPGKTTTQIISDTEQHLLNLHPNVKGMYRQAVGSVAAQTPGDFAKKLVIVAQKANNGSVWLIAENQVNEIDFSSIDKQCNI